MRTKFRYLMIVSVVVAVLVNVVPFEAECYEKGKKHLAVYFNPDVTVEDPIAAVSAMKPFTDYLGKKLDVVFEPYFFKKQEDLDRFQKTHKISFGIYSQMYIVENHVKQDFYPIAIALKEGQPFYRKVILVRKESPFEALEDLQGKILATTALGDDNIPFLNKVVFRGEIDVRTHFGKMNVVDSANSAIMAVLYKQVDAAATNYLNFVFMKELNPQVSTRLKSIYTSSKTPLPGLVVYRDSVEDDLAKVCKQEMMIMHESPTGSQAMLTFQVDAWGPANIEDWAETAKLLGYNMKGQKLDAAEPVTTPGKTTAAASEKKKAPEKKLPLVKFKRLIARDKAEQNRIAISARVITENTQLKADSVTLSYALTAGGSQEKKSGTVAMARTKEDTFEGLVPTPQITSSGSQKKVVYTVKSGDTLGKVARKFLGDSRKYMQIANFNKLKNPHMIYIGQKLTILSGEFTGIELTYSIKATDSEGTEFSSGPKFFSVVR